MIRNNENLITALIGKSDGDENTNLSKTLEDGIVSNGDTIGQHIGGIQQGILLFKTKLKAKFAEIVAYSAALSAHTHLVAPAAPPAVPVTPGGPLAPSVPPVPLLLAPIPRTGPLGDGSPITPEDTKLTINWANEAAASANMTKGERAVFEMMSLDTEELLRFLDSVREVGAVAHVTDIPGGFRYLRSQFVSFQECMCIVMAMQAIIATAILRKEQNIAMLLVSMRVIIQFYNVRAIGKNHTD